MNNNFYDYHPSLNLFYFLGIMILSWNLNHPIFILIGLIGGVSYSIYLNGKKAMKFNLFVGLPMALGIALINPLISHQGNTILFYLNNRPITRESIIYGIVSGVMIVSIMIWFSCYNKIITSDKFIYLFGRTIPTIALIISMSLGFVPKFKKRIEGVRAAQKNIGRDVTNGNLEKKIVHGTQIISILITWALENGVETADSMKCRGYGVRRRNSFSLYKFEKRDFISWVILSITFIICLVGSFYGENTYQYYPMIKGEEMSYLTLLYGMCYGLFVFFPLIIEGVEELRWKLLRLKI